MFTQILMFDKGIMDSRSQRQKEIESLYVEKGFDFEPIFREALARILKDEAPTNYRGRGYYAIRMNWMVIGLLKDAYPDHMKVDEQKRNYFQLDKNVRIYFKKLDEMYRPVNIVTDHVRNMNCRSLMLNDEPVSVLYGGFRLREDLHWDAFDGCYLVEMVNLKRTNWVSDLEDLAFQIVKKQTSPTPIFKAAIPADIIFRSKGKNEDKTKNG